MKRKIRNRSKLEICWKGILCIKVTRDSENTQIGGHDKPKRSNWHSIFRIVIVLLRIIAFFITPFNTGGV